MQRKCVERVAGARVDFADDRIVPRNNPVRIARKARHGLPADAHIAKIIDDRKGTAPMHVGVVMRCIGGQHDRPARRLDPHHLEAVGMAADPMQRHSGRNFAFVGMKRDALAEHVAHHQGHMLHRERMPQRSETHAPPGGVAHLAILQVKPRVRKQIKIAGVVVMQMGNDDVLDLVRLDTEPGQRFDGIERQLAIAQSRFRRIESGIDQDIAAAATDQPDEIIEVLRGGLMRIGHHEIQVRGAWRHCRIAQRVDFVGVSHLVHFFWMGWAIWADRNKASFILKRQIVDAADSALRRLTAVDRAGRRDLIVRIPWSRVVEAQAGIGAR